MLSFKDFISEEVFHGKVYHGSGTVFDKFDQRKARVANDFYGGGVAYFTDNVKVAIQYAKSMAKTAKTGTPFVYTCDLNLRNVFDVDEQFTGKKLQQILPKDIETFARGAGMLGWDKDKYKIIGDLKAGKATLSGDEVFKGLSSGMNQTAAARQYLMDKGYDGLRYNGGLNMNMHTKHNVYLAYYAKSIKIDKRQKVVKKS